MTFEKNELELEVTEAICRATITIAAIYQQVVFFQYLNGLRMHVLLLYESECA